MSPNAAARPAATCESFGHYVGVILKIFNETIKVLPIPCTPAEYEPWFSCRAPRRALVIVTTAQRFPALSSPPLH